MAFYNQHLRCAPFICAENGTKTSFNFTGKLFVELMVNNCVVLQTELVEMLMIIFIVLDSKDFTDFPNGNYIKYYK